MVNYKGLDCLITYGFNQQQVTLVVLLGAPPAGVLTFFLAGAVAKHMTHAVPTALLGIPGDTSATALLADANYLRKLGVPHIALRKMISGGAVAALIAVPLSVLFAVLLAPFGAVIKQFAPWVFLCAAFTIAYFSAGRWAAVLALGIGGIAGGFAGAWLLHRLPEKVLRGFVVVVGVVLTVWLFVRA